VINIFYTSIELGLLYAPVVLGVFLTFRILSFPDLTVDGSFVAGAAATAVAIKYGFSGLPALGFGFIAGLFGGCLTALLHTRLGIGKILSGILSLSILYTFNLRLMRGPNVSLLNEPKIIGSFNAPLNHYLTILFLLLIVILVKLFIDWFLKTEFGLLLRATGDNELTAESLSINTKLTKFVGIALSNGFVGLAGGLLAQFQGFSDISMGTGTIVLALAALMLGETIIVSTKNSHATLGIIAGSIFYQLIVNIALRLGLAGTDLKFITAMIVIVSLIIGSSKKYFSANEKKLFNN
jgi:putative ABC transport system permease protein